MYRAPHSTGRPPRRRRLLVSLLATGAAVAGLSVGIGSSAYAASSSAHPLGALSVATQSGSDIKIGGWAVDPDTTASATVKITLNGALAATITANKPRAGTPSDYGSGRGFSDRLPEPAGSYQVCAWAIDYPSPTHRYQLGCRTVVIDYDPYGRLDALTQQPGYVTVSGWTVDPDAPTSARPVTVRMDGAVVATGTANLARPDVATAHPNAGADHGFSFSVRAHEGKHTFCVRARNIGPGENHTLPCATRTVSYSPTGAITLATQRPGGFKITGWAADPDTASAIHVAVVVNGNTRASVAANGAGGKRPGHGLSTVVRLPGPSKPGKRHICLLASNASPYGNDRTVACTDVTLNYNPRASLSGANQVARGVHVTGWSVDPDTDAAITADITVDGKKVKAVTAGGSGGSHPGHGLSVVVPFGTDGKHIVCLVGVNTLFGTGNSAPSCRTVHLNFRPYGSFGHLNRTPSGSHLRVRAWAIDPDTTAPVHIRVTVDGKLIGTPLASETRSALSRLHPGAGTAHGLDTTFAAGQGEHTVCLAAVNVYGGGGNHLLGCKLVIAVHPKPPSAPRSVQAVAGYGGATVQWAAPASDGGAPWSGYTVTSHPGGVTKSVGAGANSATVLGLEPKTSYTFSVVATNVAGTSAAGTSGSVRTEAAPPAQRTPAPISTSRYTRNIKDASSAERAMMKNEGAADAKANPSGHGYLILLDIGGQDDSAHGVVLSAGIRFVTYTTLVADLESYVAGYAGAQRPSAPITIALGTNNDMQVSKTSGAHWADLVVDPVAKFAARFPGVTIAGANDIEPGFRASYTATRAWLTGYLGATHTPFVFNGSADGCAWTATNRGCNNGWTMSGLYNLAGGAAPVRIINLPQVYNTTMAEQWRYISLTGVQHHDPRINFGGALTEWTACRQAGGCGSITGNAAWKLMWAQLRAQPELRISSLPYSTDLRIDR